MAVGSNGTQQTVLMRALNSMHSGTGMLLRVIRSRAQIQMCAEMFGTRRRKNRSHVVSTLARSRQ